MNLSRRVVLTVLTAFVFLNVLLRYPVLPHETGIDSFFIHTLTEGITLSGQARWVLNPLSLFGLYPLSYPSVGPFFFSAFAQTAGISTEAAILLASLLFGAASVPVSFMMARALRKDDVFGIAVAFLFSLSPRFLIFTLWTGSARGLFMLLLLLFVWSLLHAYRNPTKANIALIPLVLALAAATHRLAVLLVLVLLAFVLTYIIVVTLRLLRLRAPRLMLRPVIRRYASLLTLLVIVFLAGAFLVGTDILQEYEQSRLTEGGGTLRQVISLGGSIGRSVGLALPFALIGVAYLPFLRNKGLPETLVLMILFALLPTLFLRRYTGFYITPFIALFGGLGVVFLVRLARTNRRAAAAILVTCLVVSGGVSVVARDWEVEQLPYIPDPSYTSGLYIRYLPGRGTIVANHGLTGVHIAAVSAQPYLPVGGAGTTFQSPELLVFGFYGGQEVIEQTIRLPLQDLTIESDSPFYLYAINAEADWAKMLQNYAWCHVRPSDQNRYDVTYYLNEEYLTQNGEWSFWAYDSRYPNAFAQSVELGYADFPTVNALDDCRQQGGARWKMMDSGPQTLWLVFPARAFR